MTERTTWWGDCLRRLADPGARRWYWGSIWGLVYLAIPVIIVWLNDPDHVGAGLTTALVVVIAIAYVTIPPLVWGRRTLTVVLVFAGFIAFTCLAFPLIDVNAIYFWIYPPIMAAFSWQPRWFTIGTLVVLVAAQLTVAAVSGEFATYWYAPAITVSVGFMMFAFSEQIRTIIKLRDAQAEIARLAIVDERVRFARDMHDVLGHSLTVVTVKSELARKLVRRDPDRAETELADIERLGRSALTDLRAAVAGYREMGLPTELSAANAALVAADIVPHLPTNADVVDPEFRELFAWVLRESVTNIIRHSAARNCWVALERTRIAIGDDGRGYSAAAAAVHGPGPGEDAPGGDRGAGEDAPGRGRGPVAGSGLAGLTARAAAVGAQLSVQPADGGGTVVTVERVDGGSARAAGRAAGNGIGVTAVAGAGRDSSGRAADE